MKGRAAVILRSLETRPLFEDSFYIHSCYMKVMEMVEGVLYKYKE